MRKRRETVYLQVLNLISKEHVGVTLTSLSKYLKTSKQNMSFYLATLEKEGKVRGRKMGIIKPYYITKQGKAYLTDSNFDSSLSGGFDTLTDTLTTPTIGTPKLSNLHNLSFKFDIKKYADIWFPNEVQLRNWVKRYDWFGDALVTIYGKSSLEVRFKIKCGDPHEATWRAWNRVLRFAEALERSYGIELGYPVMNRRPVHYAHTGDKAVDVLSKECVTYVEDVGHIDRSGDSGELEYYTPEDSKKYILLPRTVEDIREHQMNQQKQLNSVVEALDDLRKNTPRLDTLNTDEDKAGSEEKSSSKPPDELYG